MIFSKLICLVLISNTATTTLKHPPCKKAAKTHNCSQHTFPNTLPKFEMNNQDGGEAMQLGLSL